MSWFTRRPKVPTPPRKVEVGKATVTVTTFDGRTFSLTFRGRYAGPDFDGGDWITNASERVDTWLRRNADEGAVFVRQPDREDEDVYVGLNNVKDITVVHGKHQVEVPQ